MQLIIYYLPLSTPNDKQMEDVRTTRLLEKLEQLQEENERMRDALKSVKEDLNEIDSQPLSYDDWVTISSLRNMLKKY